MERLGGFIKVYRSMKNWGWYTDIVVKTLFIHILLCAAFEDFTYIGKDFKAGQMIMSRQRMADETGLTVKQVRGAMEKLKRTGEISVETTTRYCIVTVNNWHKFQDTGDISPIFLANKGQTQGTQRAGEGQQYKKEKNKKKVNNSIYTGATATTEKKRHPFAAYDLELFERMLDEDDQ